MPFITINTLILFQDQWFIAACFAVFISLLSSILTPFLPESPLWLLGRNKADAALKSLMTLRGATSAECVEKEFSEMRASMSLKSAKCSWNTTINNLSKPEAYKPLMIMNVFYLFQQLSGVTIIITYGVSITQLVLLYFISWIFLSSYVINKVV